MVSRSWRSCETVALTPNDATETCKDLSLGSLFPSQSASESTPRKAAGLVARSGSLPGLPQTPPPPQTPGCAAASLPPPKHQKGGCPLKRSPRLRTLQQPPPMHGQPPVGHQRAPHPASQSHEESTHQQQACREGGRQGREPPLRGILQRRDSHPLVVCRELLRMLSDLWWPGIR